jgi:phosphoribosylformylglycinamidine cyclo-ligase
MLRAFNCGIGLVAAVDPARADALASLFEAAGERVRRIGRVASGEGVRYAGRL